MPTLSSIPSMSESKLVLLTSFQDRVMNFTPVLITWDWEITPTFYRHNKLEITTLPHPQSKIFLPFRQLLCFKSTVISTTSSSTSSILCWISRESIASPAKAWGYYPTCSLSHPISFKARNPSGIIASEHDWSKDDLLPNHPITYLMGQYRIVSSQRMRFLMSKWMKLWS